MRFVFVLFTVAAMQKIEIYVAVSYCATPPYTIVAHENQSERRTQIEAKQSKANWIEPAVYMNQRKI